MAVAALLYASPTTRKKENTERLTTEQTGSVESAACEHNEGSCCGRGSGAASPPCVRAWEVHACVCSCASERLHEDFKGMLAPERKSSAPCVCFLAIFHTVNGLCWKAFVCQDSTLIT